MGLDMRDRRERQDRRSPVDQRLFEVFCLVDSVHISVVDLASLLRQVDERPHIQGPDRPR